MENSINFFFFETIPKSLFFLLKTEIHIKILNTEPILCDFRGLRYLQNKKGFRKRQVHIHTNLKWSSQRQSGLERPRLAPEWPGHPMRDQLGQLGAPEGLSGYDQASQEPARASQDHSCAVRTNSGQYEYVLAYSGTPFCFANISAP